MRSLVIIAALLSPSLLSFGCSSNCVSTDAQAAFRVTITDGTSGTKICDAELDTDLGWAANTNTIDCTYTIDIPEQGQALVITARKPGYQEATKTVNSDYESDSCGNAIQVPVQMQMQRI